MKSIHYADKKVADNQARRFTLALCLSCFFLTALDCRSFTEPETPVSALLPTLPGYSTQPVEGSIQAALDALNLDIGGLGGFIEVIGAFEEVVACLRERGVVDIRVYVNSSINADIGVVGAVNSSRAGGNSLLCTLGAIFIPDDCEACLGEAINPCADSGSFIFENDTIRYGYAGVTENFCAAVNSHFGSF